MTTTPEELEQKVAHLEKVCEAARTKADTAAEVALAAVESNRHLQAALESGHAQQSAMLAAMRTMTSLCEGLAKAVMGVKHPD